jgi:hypothetical protein
LELFKDPKIGNGKIVNLNLIRGNCFLVIGELPSRLSRRACREGHVPRAGRGWNRRGRNSWPAIYPKGRWGGGVVGGWTAKGELVDGEERGSGIVDR